MAVSPSARVGAGPEGVRASLHIHILRVALHMHRWAEGLSPGTQKRGGAPGLAITLCSGSCQVFLGKFSNWSKTKPLVTLKRQGEGPPTGGPGTVFGSQTVRVNSVRPTR